MTLEDAGKPNLGPEYANHVVFNRLTEYASFYNSLSFHVMSWMTSGTTALTNIDTYLYSSICGTIESISDTLRKGRISDAYSLVRKFYDSTIINVYSDLYLDDNYKLDNFIVSQINDWLHGTKQLPEYRVMSQYVKKSPKLQPITALLAADNTYKHTRERCNDHTHYNFYKNLLINSNVYINGRTRILDTFIKDVDAIFIQHFSYLFYLREHYMRATDYIDCLDMGMKPDENTLYYVAKFVQDMFDNIIKVKRPDLAAALKAKTAMQLE